MKKQKVFVLENKKLKVIVVKCNNKEVVSSGEVL